MAKTKTTTPFVLPGLVRRDASDASEPAAAVASSPMLESRGGAAATVAPASDSASSTLLPADLSLGSLQPDLTAWGGDATSGLDGVLQSLLVPGLEWSAPPVDRTCKYRKGRCSQPRTRKRNGDLHSYCDHHRQKSILNQRRFDRKRRLQRLTKMAQQPDSASPRSRTQDGVDAPSSSPSSLDGEEDHDAAVPLGNNPHDSTHDGHCGHAACCTGDQAGDGTCACGEQCKDVRYDINFITGAAHKV